MVIVTSVVESGVHGGLEIVQRSTQMPSPPPVCVKVAFGVFASGLNVPVNPPVTIDQVPVPLVGALPPSAEVVPFRQMVCVDGLTVAVVGLLLIVMVAFEVASVVQGEFALAVRVTVAEPAVISAAVGVNVVVNELGLPNVPPPASDQLTLD